VPKPWATVAIAIGEPMAIAADADARAIEDGRRALEERLRALEQRATALLEGR
jgi:lysophospholipid acyltransferase (LPLAT)-like uncharacterized protein